MSDLAALGISAGAERIYRYLLAHPGSSGDDLLADLDMARDSADAALKQLEKGLLVRSGSHGFGFEVADPAVAVERLIEDRLESISLELQKVSATRRVIPWLVQERGRGKIGSHFRELERVEDVEQIRTRLEDLSFFAFREILSLIPGSRLLPEAIAAARPLDLRCLRRGISLRTIVSSDMLSDPVSAAYITEVVSLGAQVRIMKDPGDGFLVYDHETAVVPEHPDRFDSRAVLVQQPGLVSGIVSFFEKLWGDAEETVEPHGDTSTGILSETERQVLLLLSRSEKDEAAAREMGISVRTFRRHVADLMLQLGAGSRFQAALLAKNKGWL
ncbi:LuxR C-terminal-related transcriptional regulator [Streptomyces sp. NBC_01077]|uniref:LuxR C-terminal-related transcriptional regulator n=1 Tax=Streptomyces sp. NBC_01077 TaxID=2903746 RepID=UPI00386D9FC9|nr:LuxR C-terminal-related transcriptional regulator [Streptomyces sp. NBC_01077]WSV43493.1 LuxR C-terminal-related transcriptional regulator [Streptomyces sp. NBC_01077]